MKKQSAHLLKGHLIRSAFYLMLLLAVCVIPFALGQRKSNKPTIAAKPNIANTNPAVAAARGDMPSFTGAAGVSDAHKAGLEVRKPSSGSIGVHRFPTLSTPQVVPHAQPSLSAASTTLAPTATPTQCQLRVLIVHTELSGPPTAIHDQIAREQGVTEVEFWDAHRSTPTLQVLQQYDIVFAFDAGGDWNDPLVMGNVLADYEDGGGVVVVGDAAWYNSYHWYLEGRWMFDGYSPYGLTIQNLYDFNTACIIDKSHPLMAGVNELTAQNRNGVTLDSEATAVAIWTDGPPAVAYKTNNDRTAVGINAPPR